jgi:hypothetical protein
MIGARQKAQTAPEKHGSQYGNPYEIGKDGSRDEVIAKHRANLESMPNLQGFIAPLRKFAYLSCWCKLDDKCHVDNYIELLKNAPPKST